MAARVMGSCVAVCLLVLALGGTAWAYDYETCFAFDPVFVQADQRRAPAAPTKPESAATTRPSADSTATPAPRLSLRAVVEALKALSTKSGSPTVDVNGR